jgi:hypothetical protein
MPRHERFRASRSVLPFRPVLHLTLACAAALLCFGAPHAGAAREPQSAQLVEPTPGPVRSVKPAMLVGRAIVNFGDLARQEAWSHSGIRPPIRPLYHGKAKPAEPVSSQAPVGYETPVTPAVASPGPTSSFIGLDDIPMVDSSYIIIPPDVGGAVGRTMIMSGYNNNYRIHGKSDGSEIATLGTATFWAPSGETALSSLTDPRTMYDPYNDRWIAVMQTFVAGNGNILVGVSQTPDPTGNWYLYRFSTGATVDFPNVGFNKNWIVVSINRYSNAGTFQRGITLIVDYPLARAGTGSGSIVTQQMNTHFCSSPCATYSATSDTLYIVTHLTSSSGTYAIDTVTGTPSAPVYTAGGTQTRPGGGWAQPGGQILPQSAPNSGASVCSPPCALESQDAQLRSAPVHRGGHIYYAQTIGLPSTGLAHTGVQWTKLAVPGGTFVEGGRIEDPAATSTNGGKWYAYPHIAVNAAGDAMVGYSQFSSAQHPSAGYSMHLAGDAAGSVRDPVIYKPGEDYYHKDFGSGRNRWGDFSQAQVDPSDDMSLWTVQEYAKQRVSTNDGTSGANGSRWGTWWANVAGPAPAVAIVADANLDEGDGGLTPYTFTIGLSTGYSVPVTVNYQTVDGTATVADNDYVAAGGSITIPAGETSAAITVHAVGDTKVEADEAFQVALTTATNGVIGVPATVTATIVNDDAGFTIAASAGPGGTIDPSGAVTVAPGGSQTFTITPDPCAHIAKIVVDGDSVGVMPIYTFSGVTGPHTILASFAYDRTLGIGEVVALEGNSGTTEYSFPLNLSGPCPVPVTVDWQTVDGTAQAASGDYTAVSNVATFAPGVTSQVLVVQVNGDEVPEETETFDVQLSNPASAGILIAQGTGTILNDDAVTAVEETAVRDLSFRVVGQVPAPGTVRFRIGLPSQARVNLSIYDVLGRRVAQPVRGELPAGYHTVRWSAREAGASLGSGVYFARFTAGDRTIRQRFVVLK